MEDKKRFVSRKGENKYRDAWGYRVSPYIHASSFMFSYLRGCLSLLRVCQGEMDQPWNE